MLSYDGNSPRRSQTVYITWHQVRLRQNCSRSKKTGGTDCNLVLNGLKPFDLLDEIILKHNFYLEGSIYVPLCSL